MGDIRNILFIMYDQLRFDYLGCAGHPHLKTPNFDRVAAGGVRFSRAYVQSPVCGASRMSAYTGRYCQSHGAQGNGYPLRVGELTLGDHMRRLGWGCHLIGKTHMRADAEGMRRLGLAPDSVIGLRSSECGFDPWIRDDGLWSEGPDGFYDTRRSPYNAYLQSKGYEGANPWHDFANSGRTGDGDMAGGFFMQNAGLPANVAEQDSETPWLTARAIDFIEAQGDAPWLAHVSYIKPHWPYIVPAPYHAMYTSADVLPPVRHERELSEAHPVMQGYMSGPVGRAFSRPEVRDTVIPAYMGLIRQCDDQLGRLLDHLRDTGRLDSTMIVLTSDHGDYLGDHWMGEKNLFHDCSVKVPMIICDPRPQADATRGTVCDDLVEMIDLLPTFFETAGGDPADIDHIAEGRSLIGILHGRRPDDWRDCAISEFDYSTTPIGPRLGLAPRDCRLMMVATRRWKFMHAEGGLRPQLFDLEKDPGELVDLGADPAHAGVVAQMYGHLHRWARRMSQRQTLSEADIEAMRGKALRRGILLGMWDGSEWDRELQQRQSPRPVPGYGDG